MMVTNNDTEFVHRGVDVAGFCDHDLRRLTGGLSSRTLPVVCKSVTVLSPLLRKPVEQGVGKLRCFSNEASPCSSHTTKRLLDGKHIGKEKPKRKTLSKFGEIWSWESLEKPVKQFVTADGQWKWESFRQLLLEEALEQISRISPVRDSDQPDFCSWILSSSGEFTVQSAYKWNDASPKWTLAWYWPGPQRIRTFPWLVQHKKLLTNNAPFAEGDTNHMADGSGKTSVLVNNTLPGPSPLEFSVGRSGKLGINSFLMTKPRNHIG
ncbi:hypothetical protein K1719_035473 [Acacia pycnantha]|nr:hypothetical protein K1719_035473 [Acacia pycnantha]